VFVEAGNVAEVCGSGIAVGKEEVSHAGQFSIRRCLWATAIFAFAMAFVRLTYAHWMLAMPMFTLMTGGLVFSAMGILVGGRQSFISWGAIGAFGGFLVPPFYLMACEVPVIWNIYSRHGRATLVIALLEIGAIALLLIFLSLRRPKKRASAVKPRT